MNEIDILYFSIFVVELKSPQNVEVSPGSVTHTSMIVTWDLVSKANSYSVS